MVIQIFLEGDDPDQHYFLPTLRERSRNIRRNMYTKSGGLPPKTDWLFEEEGIAYKILKTHMPNLEEKGSISADEKRPADEYGHNPRRTVLEEIMRDLNAKHMELHLEGGVRENYTSLAELFYAYHTLETAIKEGRSVVVRRV